ncbi:MAG: fatty acid metabolism transcriptional regulator FadR [Anaerolineales bacterium]|nr:fatty acid metabolism transcriptional regulator FadR [Anaerolineales bacterium]
MDWQPVQKPAEMAETRLLEAILSGHFPINSNLPGERELAEQIGVTRPTLREALQRLARDGWLDIQHGKPTRVRDYWREGSLAVLSVLAQSPAHQSPDFVVHLLDLRVLIAPTYARQAVQAAPAEIIAALERYMDLEDTPSAFARADWDLHALLAYHATNPVFRLLLNGFQSLYLLVGDHYFASPECRQHSRNFYRSLLDCARRGAASDAETLTRRVMEESLAFAKNM